MSILMKYVGNEVKELIDKFYEKSKDELDNNIQDRIGYINIYHNKWDVSDHPELIFLLDKMSSFLNIERNRILTINFLISKPNCKNQHYHIDYEGNTETFFIPLCELNDMNGTEIVQFNNIHDNIKHLHTLLEISNTCYNKSNLIEKLNQNNIQPNMYNIMYVNCNAYSLIKIHNYLLHRGRTNDTNMDRVMFSIVIKHSNDYNLTSDKIVADAELDEHMDIKMNIIKNRNNMI